MTCNNCGADNPPTYKFCQTCGNEFELRAAPANPPPLTTFPRSQRLNNTLLFGAIGAVALACMCLCGLVFAWSYIAGDPNSMFAQSSARPSPTRRVTSTPTDDTQDTSQSTSITPSAPALPPAPNSSDATTSAPASAAAFNKWKAAQVESAFQGARLEFVTPRTMTNEDYGTVPRVAREGVRFFIPSLGGQKGGRIYSFATAKDLQTVQQYYSSQSGTPPWIFVKDNILVQIHSDLPESKANQYKNALNSLR